MLHAFYKRGALQACADAGLTKQAFLGEIIQGVPAAAKSFAKTKMMGQIKSEAREAMGIPTPPWREAGGLYELPELAAKNIKQELEEVLAPKEPEPIKLPVIHMKTPPRAVPVETT